jgi:hypothetical protein
MSVSLVKFDVTACWTCQGHHPGKPAYCPDSKPQVSLVKSYVPSPATVTER